MHHSSTKTRLRGLAIAAILLTLPTGCSTIKNLWTETDPTKGWSAGKLYNEAKSELDDGNYNNAIDLFETLEARYPFGRFAQQAQLETAYAYYKAEEPDSAIAAADRFIKLHPQNPNIDYAYYLRGLANFNRGQTFLTPFYGRDPASKDPVPLRDAFEDFGHIVKNYPSSQYAADSRDRMVFLRNELAEHELKIADFYMRRGAYVAAANRCKNLIENYQGAESVPDALVMMVQAYRALDLDEAARDAMQVLQANYPELARDTERRREGFFERLF
ncbi:MAG: outer membrane protein assembly factor BamD [Gammaproteobacteria bacterium]|jgi:outer membrane protein assembly factor BamD|nr:outer membrane protein assembly factor BamD [Gammaproteobacteria bacterium]